MPEPGLRILTLLVGRGKQRMTNETFKPQTGNVTAEGDDIYYEVRGHGLN